MPGLRPVEILLVEDNEGDVRLTQEALKESKLRVKLNVVLDGVEAMQYLRQEGRYKAVNQPDLILLDLNLPRKSGMEVLEDVKNDPALKDIPVVIMTSSSAEADIVKSYRLHANCYITKPLDLNQFVEVVKAVDNFWLTIVKLPRLSVGQ